MPPKIKEQTSKFKGVGFNAQKQTWYARFCPGKGRKPIWLGVFKEEEAAAKAYCNFAKCFYESLLQEIQTGSVSLEKCFDRAISVEDAQ